MSEYLHGLALRVMADRIAMGLLACNVVAVVIAASDPPVTVAIMFLYWAECVVIGLLNMVKLYYVDGLDGKPNSVSLEEGEWQALRPAYKMLLRSSWPGIFLLHYGGFAFIVFTMLFALGEREAPGYNLAGHLAGFLLPVLLIAAGHLASFYRNFLGKREYLGRSVEDQTFRPYKRVMLMLVIVFAGIGVVVVTGLPGMALLVFVPFKIIADLEAHFREHTA